MNLEEQLAQYRQRYSFESAKADAKETSPWDGEIESLKEVEEEDIHDVWAAEIGSDMNTTYSPSRQDYDDYVRGMMEQPLVQKYQGDIEAVLNELMNAINDPSNPMDAQQAQQIFADLMEQNILPDAEGFDAPQKPKKGRK